MYTPEAFKIDDEAMIHTFIKANSFATLIATIDNRLEVTHLPIDRLQDGRYYGHLSRDNPLSTIKRGAEVCVVFTGPHAYISPNMYASEFNVPTWNYSAVHCYGRVEYMEDEVEVWERFHGVVGRYEGEEGWQLPDEEKFQALSEYIRFFEFKIDTIEAKFKFNQNKSDEDIQSVIGSLRDVGNAKAADFMEQVTGKRHLRE